MNTHQIVIDARGIPHDEWRAICNALDAQAYTYSSTSQDYKIYIECASLSQMADIVELVREISDLN